MTKRTPADFSQRRRYLMAGLAGAGTAALAGCMNGSSTYPKNPEPATGPVTTAPLPDNPTDYPYAVMGDADASVGIVYYGSWKCPYCADFSTGLLQDIVTDYVEPGDVKLQFRGLAYLGGETFLGPDAPTATRAGLSVWKHDPETYWKYHEFIFKNQPSEKKQWATTENMVKFAEDAGVGPTDAVKSDIKDNAYEDLLNKSAQAAKNVGVQGTPMLVINGTLINGMSESKVRSRIEDGLS